MRLLSLFSFSGGPVAQDLWSSPEPMKKWVASYGLAQNDSSLSIVHGLLEVEGALVQSLPIEKDCRCMTYIKYARKMREACVVQLLCECEVQ